MEDQTWLAERFEADRDHLRGVAYRMLGSLAEADDAVQEAWVRLSRSDTAGVDNLTGWLTTVVGRVCLDVLRSRRVRSRVSLDEAGVERAAGAGADLDPEVDPEGEAVLADSVGLALLVVLDTLTPAERLAFVLHDMFDLPFDEIAPLVGRTPAAARQLASRARRRVQGRAPEPGSDLARRREVVGAYLAAARRGDFDALVSLLDPGVVLHVDGAAAFTGRETELVGAAAVARGALASARRSRHAELALVDGAPAVVVAPRGVLQLVLLFELRDDRIVALDVVGAPERLAQLEVAVLA